MEALPDVESLLEPIAGEEATGRDLREDSGQNTLFRRLRDARVGATGEERRRLENDDPEADTSIASGWGVILDEAPAALIEHSKDLEIAAWAAEAAVRVDGMPGLARGLDLLAGLIERYWPDLHPRMEDEDDVGGLRAVGMILGESGEGTLLAPLRRTLIASTPAGSYAYWQHEAAFALEQMPEERRLKRIEAGALTLDQIRNAGLATPAAFFTPLLGEIAHLQEALARLDGVMSEHCGYKAPSTSRLRNFLEQMDETVRGLGGRDEAEIAAEAEATAATYEDSQQEAAGVPGGGAAGGSAAGGFTLTADPARNRDAALRTLMEVADFFRRTEPHSLLSYTLTDAVRRANLSLPELMAELLPDDDTRRAMFANAGVKLAEEQEEEQQSW